MSEIVEKCNGFDWDDHNISKNMLKHNVHFIECEEIFYNEQLIVTEDIAHSREENRYFALGHTNAGRLIFLVFTVRGTKIRVISARDMNKNERIIYAEKIEKNS